MWRLRVVRGSASPGSIPVADGLTLGRSVESDLVFHDPLVSRVHARLVVRGGDVDLVDLGSANGTEVNGARVDRQRLASGDRLRVGDADVVFEEDDGTAPTAAAEASSRRRSQLGRTTVRVRSAFEAPSADDTAQVWIDDAEPATPAASRLQRFALGAARATRADLAFVLVRVVAGGPHVVAARSPEMEGPEPAPLPRSLLARASRQSQALLLASDVGDVRDGTARTRHRGTALCAPLGKGGAVVYVERLGTSPAFAASDVEPFAALAARAAPSLQQEIAWFQWRESMECGPPSDGGAVLVGESPAFLAMLDVAEHVAPSHAPVLVRGEPGTGRRLLARLLHDRGRGLRRPFVVACCAELPRGGEVEALFGETAGGRRRPGLLEDVGSGTVCLAEITDLAPAAQAALADALTASRYQPVGGGEPRRLRCRVVATTSRNLDPLAAGGQFHAGLAGVLSGLVVGVPALAERDGDVPLLVEHFAAVQGRRVNGRPTTVTVRARDALRRRSFPRHVAELANLVERAVLRARNGELDTGDFEDRSPVEAGEDLTLRAAERAAILRALAASRGRKGRAAELLGISWPTLTRKVREYGIE